MFKSIIEAKTNVRIIARENGKKVPGLCRETHNVWVNIGRQYLAEVISPLNSSFNAHYNDAPARVVEYMALGIGGNSQRFNIAEVFPFLNTHYPGGSTFDDSLVTIDFLERPVKVSGIPGVGSAPGNWLSQVTAPPTFMSVVPGGPITVVQFDTLFQYTDVNLLPAYPSVPLSEIGLMLSSEQPERTSDEVYDYTGAPYINYSTRQKLIAYNTFEPILKTLSVALEVYWEIQF